MKLPNVIAWTKGWIILCVFLSSSGWLLSLVGHLDRAGYSVVFALGLATLAVTGRRLQPRSRVHISARKLKWRFSHALPAIFLVLACLAFLGGILYSPTNYDGLTYRFPRVLHWLAEHRWHWIATVNDRMNYSGTGFEWLMAPCFAFTQSDRFFFLVNMASLVLMPGLVYGTFTRLGVARRMAWCWMWLLPCGYCFIAQAGGIGNDGFSAVFLLASVYFALEARRSGRVSDLWFGALAAALLTASKACNIPLVLPWFIVFLTTVDLLKKRLLASVVVGGVMGLASFAPIALLNIHYCGQWGGNSKADDHQMALTSPVHGILGNCLQIVTRNAMPPVMPLAKVWNEKTQKLIQSGPFRSLVQHFPRLTLSWNELEQEEAAGLGLGLSALLLVTGVASLRGKSMLRPSPPLFSAPALGKLVCLACVVSLLAYMAKLGSESAARLISPYYPLLIGGVLLLPGAAALPRRRWWRNLTVVAALSALPVVVLTPSRPLWPALGILQKLAAKVPGNRLIERGLTVYATYRERADCLGPLRKHIPAGTEAVMFAGSDEPEVSLWRPFGTRRVFDLTAASEVGLRKEPSIVIASEDGLADIYKGTVDQWVATLNGKVLGKEKLLTKVSRGIKEWYVIQTATLRER